MKIFTNSLRILCLVIMVSGFSACTDLEEPLFDRVTADNFYSNDAEVEAAVASVYQHMTNFSFWYVMVMDNASDAATIYTHTGGWNNDRHRRTDTHELRGADNLAFPLNQVWNNIFEGIAKANVTINSIDENVEESAVKSQFLGELKVLRAWFYFLGMDVYGDMPIVTESRLDPANLPSRAPRADVFDFVEAELLQAIDDLPSGQENFPRINKETARAVLAHLYLNAEVFTGTGRWQDCITQCDAIMAVGDYSLASNYFDLFSVNNEAAASEMLFYVDHEPGVSGGSIGWVRATSNTAYMQEYYPNLPYNVWNGPAVQPTFYRQYDDDDLRKQQGFLEGQMYTKSGDPLVDANGFLVDHKIDFYLRPSDGPDGYQALYEGVRIWKWGVDINAVDANQGNGFPVIGLADILLQKAESLIRLNGPNGESDQLINQVRARVFDPAKPLTGATLDDVYWERGFELFSEGQRRRDQIRFDRFHLADDFHPEHDRNFNLFPIPDSEILANPNLSQNPGY